MIAVRGRSAGVTVVVGLLFVGCGSSTPGRGVGGAAGHGTAGAGTGGATAGTAGHTGSGGGGATAGTAGHTGTGGQIGGTGGSGQGGGFGGSGSGGRSGCADYASNFCAEIQTCAPGILQVFGYGDRAGCLKAYAASCNDALVAPGATWTTSQAEQCGNAYAGVSCATFLGQGGVPTPCLVRPGTVANGGPCSTPSQCASGRCSLTTVGGCGTCAAVVPLGQPCTPNELLGGTCDDDLVCAVTSPGGTSTVCAAGVPIGGPCADTTVCPLNAYCDLVTHVCTKLPAVGQSCDASQIYYCDPAQAGALCDATTSTCQPLTAPSSDGGCVSDGGGGTCPPSAGDGGVCALADVCNLSSGCFDLGACATFICAGADAAVASAAALERTGPWRLRRPGRLASPFTSRY